MRFLIYYFITCSIALVGTAMPKSVVLYNDFGKQNIKEEDVTGFIDLNNLKADEIAELFKMNKFTNIFQQNHFVTITKNANYWMPFKYQTNQDGKSGFWNFMIHM